MKYPVLCFLIGLTGLSGCSNALPPESAVISLTELSKESGIVQGVAFDASNGDIYYGVQGGQVKRISAEGNTEVVAEIEGAISSWSTRPGSIFVTDMQFGPDGNLYICAKKQVLVLDPITGNVEVLLDDLFSGPWGAYALDITENGSLIIGDHFGGIKFFDINNNWAQTTLVSPQDTVGPQATFSGVELDEKGKVLYGLDQAASTLLICPLKWKNGVPEVQSVETVKMDLVYPEYLRYWNGDIFVQAARENKMLRLRDGVVIQTITAAGADGSSPGSLVTFCFGESEGNSIRFLATSFNSVQGLYSGELIF